MSSISNVAVFELFSCYLLCVPGLINNLRLSDIHLLCALYSHFLTVLGITLIVWTCLILHISSLKLGNRIVKKKKGNFLEKPF